MYGVMYDILQLHNNKQNYITTICIAEKSVDIKSSWQRIVEKNATVNASHLYEEIYKNMTGIFYISMNVATGFG